MAAAGGTSVPELEHLRERARALRRDLARAEPAALARLRRQHPRRATLADDAAGASVRLADAQLVIAREQGAASWPRLHAALTAQHRAAADIAAGAPAPDGDMPTRHIRCGSDIRATLAAGGFTGAFLEVSDPLCMGPVPAGVDLPTTRAPFLADAFGLTPEAAAARLRAEQDALDRAGADVARVVLWFEHDTYDQLLLARVLDAIARWPRRPVVELICLGAWPVGGRFIGLGQVPPDGLRALWRTRRRVAGPQLRLGQAVWAALRAPDPLALHAIAAAPTPAVPPMAAALHRHLQELPWTADGMSLTERLILKALRDGPRTPGAVFRTLTQETEPLPWLGDLMLFAMLRAMRRAAAPPMRTVPDTEAPPDRTGAALALTETGAALLAGGRDWLACGPPDRWVGGVPIRAGAPSWRWDEAAQRPRPA